MSNDIDLSFDCLSEGLQFNSLEVAEKYVQSWCDEHLFPLIIRSSFKGNENQNGRIQFCCPHGVLRKSKTKGERPLQHVQYSACPAMLNVVQNRQGNCWRVTKVKKKHEGHMLGPAIYGSYQKVRKMSDEDLRMIQELESVGASRRRVASALSDKTGNVYQTKDVYNALGRIKQTIADVGKLEEYLANVQLEGGVVNWCKNQADEVSVLWVQTQSMRADVDKTKPWVWQCDTTFSTNRLETFNMTIFKQFFFYFREGYKVYIPLHKSAVTGRFQVSGLLFLATENRDNVLKGLTFFKKSLTYSPEDLGVRFHFLVDKDFDYIEVRVHSRKP